MPEITSWDQLRDLWAERDRRYRSGRGRHRPLVLGHPSDSMTRDEQEAVRSWRLAEARQLPEPARHAALVALTAWYPPSLVIR